MGLGYERLNNVEIIIGFRKMRLIIMALNSLQNRYSKIANIPYIE